MSIPSRLGAALLCAASVGALVSVAHAQNTGTQATESVVVTGSRVISNIANSPTPITAVSLDELQATTPTDIPDALNKLPVFMGSSTPADTSNAANAAIGNVLNLRNFGSQRTLVLFDGHRQPPSNSNGTVDIDTVPQMLVQRVDVVTGGASAVYGSDAVTGVVNFVLDKHFTGMKINANAGISNYLDGAQQQIGVAAGSDLFGGRGHFEGSLRYYHLDPILLNARLWGPVTSWAAIGVGTKVSPIVNVENARLNTFAYGGLISQCGGCAANGQQFVSNGILGPFQHGAPTSSPSVEMGGDGVTSQDASLQIAQVTYESFGRFSYDLDDTTSAYVQVIASQSRTTGNVGSQNAQTATSAAPNQFFSNNPFLTPAAQAALANPTGKFTSTQYWVWPWNGHQGWVNSNINRNLGLSVGLDGTLFKRFDWDLYYSHSENRLNYKKPNNFSYSRMFAANDAVTVTPANVGASGQTIGNIVCQVSLTQFANLYPGCVAMNRFGPTAMSETQYNYILANTHHTTNQALDDVSGSVSGSVFDLPAGPVKAAFNGEYRVLSFNVEDTDPQGPVDCTGLRLCNPAATQFEQDNTAPQPGVSENVLEFAGEVNVPLLKDMPLVQSLDLNLAGRYTDYSISGSVQTWKIGLDYHVNDSVHLRGTTSVDIRAPTLADLYSPITVSHNGFTDIHTGNIQQQTNVQSQGNVNLVPEVARTYTLGIVLTPSFIPGLTFSADYYQIVLKNAITSLNGTTSGVQQSCEASNGISPLCALFVRPLPFSDRTPANFPTLIYSETLNAAVNDTGGVDFEVSYGFELGDVFNGANGSVDLRSFATYQPYNNLASFPGAPITSLPVPHGRITNTVTYNLGNWGFSLADRFYTKFNRSTNPGLQFYAIPYGSAINIMDVNIDRKLEIDGSALDIYFNIKNFLNAAPPIVPSNGTSIGGSPYGEHLSNSGGGGVIGADDVGRVFTIGVRASL